MAKVSFNKLGLKKNTDVVNITQNEQDIQVKQYLPINDKAELVAKVLSYVINSSDNRFPSPMHIDVMTTICVVEKYADISFTEKQKEDPAKLFDLLLSSGLYKSIISNIDENEYHNLVNYIHQTIDNYYKYANSVFGILEAINKDYSQMSLDATKITQQLADPDNLALLKEVMTKLG